MRRRRVLIFAAVAVAAILAGSLAATLTSSSGNPSGPPLVDRTNRVAPQFSLPELSDPASNISLAQFRGKDLVVNFWASWCYPCQTEMPVLQSAYVSQGRSVEFLGIDTNDTRSPAVAFLKRVHVSYPVLFDPSGDKVANQFGLFGLPTTIFISAQGKVAGEHFGQLDRATLNSAIQLAFDRTAGT